MSIFKSILLSIMMSLCISTDSNSEVLTLYMKSFDEQKYATEWILNNSHKDMTVTQARSIVRKVYAYSYSNQINPYLVLGMMKQESNFKKYARSSKDARGLLQVIPYWHKNKFKGRNPYIEEVSIEVGIAVLKECLTRNKNIKKKALKCYSGGARNYYQKVTNHQNKIKKYIDEMNQPKETWLALAY